jgi:hypothetical protein
LFAVSLQNVEPYSLDIFKRDKNFIEETVIQFLLNRSSAGSQEAVVDFTLFTREYSDEIASSLMFEDSFYQNLFRFVWELDVLLKVFLLDPIQIIRSASLLNQLFNQLGVSFYMCIFSFLTCMP